MTGNKPNWMTWNRSGWSGKLYPVIHYSTENPQRSLEQKKYVITSYAIDPIHLKEFEVKELSSKEQLHLVTYLSEIYPAPRDEDNG